MKKIFYIAISVCMIITFSGCDIKNSETGNVPAEETTQGAIVEKETENSPLEINNPYFNADAEIKCKGDFTFSDGGVTAEVTVRCQYLGSSEVGNLYQIIFDQLEEDKIPEGVLCLGYFYVKQDKIYRMRGLSEEEKEALIALDELPEEASIVCQNTEMKDENMDRYGTHEKIVVHDNEVEYSNYYDDADIISSETFIWQKGTGMILYHQKYAPEVFEEMMLWQEGKVNNLQERKEAVFVKGTENPPLEINNPYFNSETEMSYKGDFTFTDSRETEEVTISCQYLDSSKDGNLYRIGFDQIERAEVPDELLNLGYFYVKEDKIYRMLKLSGKEKEDLITLGKIPERAYIVCQDGEIKDANEGIKGCHEKIQIKEKQVRYSQYYDWGDTGFYEVFLWQKDDGMILYKRGYGAERDAITLWQEGKVENPHDS